jgi:hypothetical protein
LRGDNSGTVNLDGRRLDREIKLQQQQPGQRHGDTVQRLQTRFVFQSQHGFAFAKIKAAAIRDCREGLD